MTGSEPRAPEDRPHPRVAPVDIPEIEKLAAQREARHDIAARGRRADPLAVQHYLAHVRCEESRQHTAGHPQAAGRRVTTPERSGGTGRAGSAADRTDTRSRPEPARPSWWQRLLSRRSAD